MLFNLFFHRRNVSTRLGAILHPSGFALRTAMRCASGVQGAVRLSRTRSGFSSHNPSIHYQGTFQEPW
jgi:hypothetical protein